MASSKQLANLISTIAFSTYFIFIIFQVPLFRMGICKTPLELTSSLLIGSDVFPHFIVKTLLYPGAFAKAIFTQKTIPSYRNLLNLYDFNSRTISAASELQRLEVLAGSYLCVGGAILGLMKPGRITLFGILLVIWGLIRILVLGKSGFSHANGVRIYPTIFIALVSAFFSIRKDVRKIIHTFNLKHVGKAKHF
ncbi:uncharacterized protein [Cicer arietinum]|uniref:uncharacterized protein isoform X2 n=1 Tax=Cicer arietinum TaxID=3827 RepID=UPI003CC5C881